MLAGGEGRRVDALAGAQIAEVRVHPAGDRIGGHLEEQHKHKSDARGERHHRSEDPPGVVVAPLGPVLGEDRNKNGGQCTAGHQVLEDVGNPERRGEDVCGEILAERMADDHVAGDAEDA